MAENNPSEFKRRSKLPVKMLPRNEVSIWAILKNSIGKDLSKITMPVILNEPLSFLQRICEYMEYAVLLTEASKQTTPEDRMKYVAAFAVSALAANWDRLGKPFNPLLGETYELKRNDYKVVCEQVSHHPPISAFHAESPDFKFHGSIHPKLKFWGKSVEIIPKGVVTVELLKWNETYTWNNVNCCVHNIVVGKLWIEQYGIMDITSHTTGHHAVLDFKAAKWSAKNLHRVEGFIQDKNKENIYYLYGKWTEFIKCATKDSYEQYMVRRNQERKSNESESTPKRVFSKLHSFKMNSLRSLSIQDHDDGLPPEMEGDIPRSNSTYSLDIPNSSTLWICNPRPDYAAEYYQFTYFALQLNEIDPDMIPPRTLCPTDSRLRPDILCLENGDLEGASKEKTRLEEQQRDKKRQNKLVRHENNWNPRWFISITNPFTNTEDWSYTDGYWDRFYSHIPNIF